MVILLRNDEIKIRQLDLSDNNIALDALELFFDSFPYKFVKVVSISLLRSIDDKSWKKLFANAKDDEKLESIDLSHNFI